MVSRKYQTLKLYPPQSIDFIMCNMVFEHCTSPSELIDKLYKIGGKDTVYYIEVPSEFPFSTNKFSIKNNLTLLLNPIYSKVRLVKYYFKQKSGAFMPMKEHINFYTFSSMRYLLESHGFNVLDLQQNTENSVLGKSRVLSALFKKST